MQTDAVTVHLYPQNAEAYNQLEEAHVVAVMDMSEEDLAQLASTDADLGECDASPKWSEAPRPSPAMHDLPYPTQPWPSS